MVSKKGIAAGVIFAILFLGCFLVYKFFILREAHRTLQNYSNFRGCAELLNVTATSAVCRIANGDAIKIVEIDGRWYLEGDGPGIW